MCNLYAMRSGPAEIGSLFGVLAEGGANFAAEVYPGYPGLVVAEACVQAMTWGFPLVLKSKVTGLPLKPKPVNNTREDKLGAAFWRDSFARRRCLIPVSAWAEAEGAKGSMARTWYGFRYRTPARLHSGSHSVLRIWASVCHGSLVRVVPDLLARQKGGPLLGGQRANRVGVQIDVAHAGRRLRALVDTGDQVAVDTRLAGQPVDLRPAHRHQLPPGAVHC
jgi:hypothetical protein